MYELFITIDFTNCHMSLCKRPSFHLISWCENFVEKLEILIISGNIDILMVSETKLDNSFSVSQFLIDGYCPPFRLDRDNNGRRIMLFVREDIPCKLFL